MSPSKKFRVIDEAIVSVNPKTGQRELKYDTLEEILDAIAECQGGYSACRGGIIVFDTVTGAKSLITLANGVVTDAPITD